MKKDGFVRSQSNPGAVINTDKAALQAYKAQKSKFKKLDKIDQLESEMGEIKHLLGAILQKLSDK
jgi:hypothetical protein